MNRIKRTRKGVQDYRELCRFRDDSLQRIKDGLGYAAEAPFLIEYQKRMTAFDPLINIKPSESRDISEFAQNLTCAFQGSAIIDDTLRMLCSEIYLEPAKKSKTFKLTSAEIGHESHTYDANDFRSVLDMSEKSFDLAEQLWQCLIQDVIVQCYVNADVYVYENFCKSKDALASSILHEPIKPSIRVSGRTVRDTLQLLDISPDHVKEQFFIDCLSKKESAISYSQSLCTQFLIALHLEHDNLRTPLRMLSFRNPYMEKKLVKDSKYFDVNSIEQREILKKFLRYIQSQNNEMRSSCALHYFSKATSIPTNFMLSFFRATGSLKPYEYATGTKKHPSIDFTSRLTQRSYLDYFLSDMNELGLATQCKIIESKMLDDWNSYSTVSPALISITECLRTGIELYAIEKAQQELSLINKDSPEDRLYISSCALRKAYHGFNPYSDLISDLAYKTTRYENDNDMLTYLNSISNEKLMATREIHRHQHVSSNTLLKSERPLRRVKIGF